MKLAGFDKVNLTGFEDYEIEELNIEQNIDYEDELDFDLPEEDDYEVDEEIECDVQEGDLYKLGNHYVLCADSLNTENIDKLLQNNKIDLVFTDPDYDLKVDILNHLNNFCKKHIFIMTSDIVQAQLINNNYEMFYEFFVVTYSAPIWNGVSINIPLHNHTLIGHYKGEDAKTPKSLKGLSSVIHNSTLPDTGEEHKFSKPLKFISPFIKYYSKEGENVLDIFGGSGSTLIACEEANRNCFVCELNPIYVQNIINRWEEYTGETAEQIL